MTSATKTSTKVEAARAFRMRLADPDGRGRYQVTVEEVNGHPDRVREVASVSPERLQFALPALNDAVKASGYAPSVLSPTRRSPIALDETAGVRLTLALTAIHRVTKSGRPQALLDGIARLSDEECFYWYAHVAPHQQYSTRRAKALRIFLARE